KDLDRKQPENGKMKINVMHLCALVVILGLGVSEGGERTVAEAQDQAEPVTHREVDKADSFVDWATATPESQGMSSAKLEALWSDLKQHNTTGFLVIRNDAVVFERY